MISLQRTDTYTIEYAENEKLILSMWQHIPDNDDFKQGLCSIVSASRQNESKKLILDMRSARIISMEQSLAAKDILVYNCAKNGIRRIAVLATKNNVSIKMMVDSMIDKIEDEYYDLKVDMFMDWDEAIEWLNRA